jgi:cytochrome P450
VNKGDIITVSLAAANRDPHRFARPNIFDPARAPIPSLAFGAGPHLCVGAPLARVEMQIALSTLFRALPTLRLAIRPGEVAWALGRVLRGVRALPVTFDPV